MFHVPTARIRARVGSSSAATVAVNGRAESADSPADAALDRASVAAGEVASLAAADLAGEAAGEAASVAAGDQGVDVTRWGGTWTGWPGVSAAAHPAARPAHSATPHRILEGRAPTRADLTR